MRACYKSVVAIVLFLLCGGSLGAQSFGGPQYASVAPQPTVAIEPGEKVTVPVKIRIRRGYHINSDRPMDDYLIPTTLTWESSAVELEKVDYPEAEIVKYEFSDNPLSVFSGQVEIRSHLKVAKSIPDSLTELRGTLRYQACTDKACLPPKTLEVTVPVEGR